MNEHTTKKILFNKSSLLNLKAELLKKQEEVIQKKQLPQNKLENFKPTPAKTSDNDTINIINKEKKKSFKDGLKAIDTEELEACRKSKIILEKKAELYEHLSDRAGNSKLTGKFLVDFKTKKDEEVKESARQEDVSPSFDSVPPIDDSDEWTEFTDCLGRTRKCHKSDVEMFMKRDKELMRIMFKDQDGSEENGEEKEATAEKPLLVQKTNDYLQSLRQKWEEKEREMLSKDKDIHYQDLLFDEARMHGVGYFAFSTDETERRKQMEELMKEREATLRAQKQTEEARRKREEIIAARVKAARARQRLRAGLPPEDPEENQKDFTTHLLEFLTQQRNEADAKAKEEERKIKEEQEKERQKLRDAYIREWDLGKEGVEDKVKRFKEMTQEEYVEQQRDKRIDEFAPLKAVSSSKSYHAFDEHGKKIDSEASKTWSDVRPKAKTLPPPDIGNFTEQKGLYFSSKTQAQESNQYNTNTENRNVTNSQVMPKETSQALLDKRDFKYRNFVKAQEPSPIVNELSDEESDLQRNELRNRNIDGVEMAPPPTYDYYGPVPKRQKFIVPFESDMGEAYAQGAKSLEAKVNARQISKEYDFMFN